MCYRRSCGQPLLSDVDPPRNEEVVTEVLATTVTIPTEKAEEMPTSVVRILEQLDALARVVMNDALDFQLDLGSNRRSKAR